MPQEMWNNYAQDSVIIPAEKRKHRNTHINTCVCPAEVFLQGCKGSERDSGASELQMLRWTSISPNLVTYFLTT